MSRESVVRPGYPQNTLDLWDSLLVSSQNSRRVGYKERRVQEAFGTPFDEVLRALYVDEQLSCEDIVAELEDRAGVGVSRVTVWRWLRMAGIPPRAREEAGRLRWSRGKMDGASAKTRRTLTLSALMGSSVEREMRWALKFGLEQALGQDYEVVVGFSALSVLPNREVDIPIVLLPRGGGDPVRIAIEIDGARYHAPGNPERDAELMRLGWQPVRMYFTGTKLTVGERDRLTRRLVQQAVELVEQPVYRPTGCGGP